ncbi:MAG: hypothetical protein R3C04_02950 [Hyphomonas sp.]
MERPLTNFIRALRSSDVRVSTGEALDAARTLKLIGYADRAMLKDSLACVLAKSPEEKVTHDELFELYFSREDLPSQSAATGRNDDTATAGNEPPDPVELMESGDEAAITLALEKAAEAAGVDDIRFSTQVAYFAQQMVKQMGGGRLQARLLEALQTGGQDGDSEAQRLIDIRRALTMRARERAEKAFDVFGAGMKPSNSEMTTPRIKTSALDRSDMERMKRLVAKIAKRLAISIRAAARSAIAANWMCAAPARQCRAGRRSGSM